MIAVAPCRFGRTSQLAGLEMVELVLLEEAGGRRQAAVRRAAACCCCYDLGKGWTEQAREMSPRGSGAAEHGERDGRD